MLTELKITYDEHTSALYIKFKDGKIAESEEVAPGIIIDLNENREVIGVEVLWVSN